MIGIAFLQSIYMRYVERCARVCAGVCVFARVAVCAQRKCRQFVVYTLHTVF